MAKIVEQTLEIKFSKLYPYNQDVSEVNIISEQLLNYVTEALATVIPDVDPALIFELYDDGTPIRKLELITDHDVPFIELHDQK